jgi:hypothetical protein
MQRSLRPAGLFISCLLLCLFAPSVRAQFRAAVQGTVADVNGAIVPGATIRLTSKETGREQTAESNTEGFYRFSGLAPGNYRVNVEKAGFKSGVIEDVIVSAEETRGLDIVLSTGEVAESVTVTDTASPALETENANVGRAITTEEVKSLPQFGRDPYELARLTPGVFGEGARGGNGGAVGLPNQTGPGGSSRAIFQAENQPQISANGQRVSANNYQVDGVSVNSLTYGGAAVITPNQESVKEVRVLANNYSAEYGRNSGAQVLVVSQNGTNVFHGSLFLKNNSPGLNAFNKYGGPAAPPVRVNTRLNQYGGSFGGPLRKDKAFFFFSYEGLRSGANDTATNFVETPQFRQLVQQLRPNSVTSRILAASGIEPRITSVIPVTCAFANFGAADCREVAGGLDLGSPTGAVGQYTTNRGGGFDGVPDVQFAQLALPTSSKGNQYNLRLDFNPTERDTFTLGTYMTRFDSLASDPPGRSRLMGDVRTKPSNASVTLTYTRTLSPVMLNEARFNVTRFSFNEIESSTETNFGLPRVEIESLPFDRIRFGAPWSEATPGIFAQNTLEARDTLRWVRGSMAWSFGGEVRWEQDNNNLSGGARPLYTFGGLFNFANDAPLFYQINADPRTGGPADSQRYFRSQTYGLFAQNDWKVRPNLTVNLGLRYEYFTPLKERRGRLSNLVFGSQGLANSQVVVTDRLYEPDRNNFAPRLGFAWSPGRLAGFETRDRLVLRGGFGIAYNRIPTVLFANTRGNPPFFARFNICCGTAGDPFAGGRILYTLGADNTPTSYPANPALGVGIDPATGAPRGGSVEVYGALPQTPNAYVYTYSFEGQYSLPANLAAEVGYQGSSSHKLIRLVNQNFLYPNNPAFFAVYFPTPDVNANYNALLARLSQRPARGVTFDAVYRWSKSIDTISNEGPGFVTNQTYPQNQRFERGPSDYDVRHHFVASGLWQLPVFRNRTDTLGRALGGWQLGTILTYHTGFPWTPLAGRCASTPGGANVCPARPFAYLGGLEQDTSNEAFISTGGTFGGRGQAAFIPNGPESTPPGIGRNVFRGPRYFDVDLSLAKRTGLPRFMGENSYLEVKANFFNVFNILNLQQFGFAAGQTFVTDSNFGRAPGGLAGRVVELQGRLIF